MEPDMKKATWYCLVGLTFLAGCAVDARPGLVQVGDKPAYTAYLGARPLFSIVTDGAVQPGCVTNTIFLVATYEGQILDAKRGIATEFRYSTASGRTLRLGGNRYDLTEGCVFLVSVKTNPLRVKQLGISEEDQLGWLTLPDERMTAFLAGN
jgi:hypothetical protein